MKRALVTGVSWDTGIGFAITKQLVEDGYLSQRRVNCKSNFGKRLL